MCHSFVPPVRPGRSNLSAPVFLFRVVAPPLWVRGARPPRNRRTNKMKVEQAKQIANKAIEELAAALNANPSEALTSYLKTVAKFHKYSFHNILLIAMACPQATHVAGFHTWRKLGRHVKKGAKVIRISLRRFGAARNRPTR